MESVFPTTMYRCPGTQPTAGPETFNTYTVFSQEEFDAAKQVGWCAELEVAVERARKLEFLKKEAAAKVKRAQEEAVNAVVENAAVLIQELEDEEEFDDSPKRKRKR